MSRTLTFKFKLNKNNKQLSSYISKADLTKKELELISSKGAPKLVTEKWRFEWDG